MDIKVWAYSVLSSEGPGQPIHVLTGTMASDSEDQARIAVHETWRKNGHPGAIIYFQMGLQPHLTLKPGVIPAHYEPGTTLMIPTEEPR